jgi:hypothetical protein
MSKENKRQPKTHEANGAGVAVCSTDRGQSNIRTSSDEQDELACVKVDRGLSSLFRDSVLH